MAGHVAERLGGAGKVRGQGHLQRRPLRRLIMIVWRETGRARTRVVVVMSLPSWELSWMCTCRTEQVCLYKYLQGHYLSLSLLPTSSMGHSFFLFGVTSGERAPLASAPLSRHGFSPWRQCKSPEQDLLSCGLLSSLQWSWGQGPALPPPATLAGICWLSFPWGGGGGVHATHFSFKKKHFHRISFCLCQIHVWVFIPTWF